MPIGGSGMETPSKNYGTGSLSACRIAIAPLRQVRAQLNAWRPRGIKGGRGQH